jgi:hypothetical protein
LHRPQQAQKTTRSGCLAAADHSPRLRPKAFVQAPDKDRRPDDRRFSHALSVTAALCCSPARLPSPESTCQETDQFATALSF